MKLTTHKATDTEQQGHYIRLTLADGTSYPAAFVPDRSYNPACPNMLPVFAAAPELLEALVGADEWLTAYVEGVGAEWDEMRASIRKAIAKAEGK